MYIDDVPNRNSPPAILLRESYRVDGKVKKRTLLNLSDWPVELVEGFRALLKGATVSKLATAKALDPATAASSLGAVLGLGEVDEDELYVALDWLLERQPQVEAALARLHLKNGTLVLYDVSSSYLEGRCCELARLGYNRDGKRGKLQIVYGLLCAPDGCPVAIEVFEGDTGDPATLAAQIDKLKQRFDLSHA